MLTLKIMDGKDQILGINQGGDETSFVYTREYKEGDRIIIESSERNIYLVVQIDDALGPAFVYVTGPIIYTVPFGEKKICYSPKTFYGSRHFITARLATREEINTYKNLAQNVIDQHGDTDCYPHATANVETRGESVFAARNAIDGVRENHSHGEWPYESWGINQQEDAKMKVDFGRSVEIDKIALYTRADFPHDNWWTKVTISFSDGTSMDWELDKSDRAHIITFEKKQVYWVKLNKLIKSEDPSPFPALSQIEVYGNEIHTV
ncbi:MAG: carbohydrate-binding protein [Anaerocolumna sp.]